MHPQNVNQTSTAEEKPLQKTRYLVLVPALQAAKTISRVMLKLAKLPFEFDVLVIDNNSKDGTLNVVESVIKEHEFKGYHLIRNVRDLGYGGSQKIALFFGIYNGYDKLIIIHADDQYPVECVPELIEFHNRTKAALTIGTRLKHPNVRNEMPWYRFYGNSAGSAMNRWAYGLNLDEYHSEFRIYDLSFMKKIDIDRCSNLSNYTLDSLLAIKDQNGLINQIVIPCRYPPDAHHPEFWDFTLYVIYNIYRAIRYKLFRR